MSDNTDSKAQGPYGRDGETVGVVDSEGKGSVTFGSREEYEKPYHDKHWLFHQYTVMKKSIATIAEMIDVNPSTIRNWLLRHDIPTRSLSEAARLASHGSSRPWEDEDWLREQYVEQTKSLCEIADEQGVSSSTIRRALEDAGIPRRIGGFDRHDLYPKLQDHDWLSHQYIDRERSISDIAEDIGAGPMTVWRELDASDIETRSYSEANKNRWRDQKSVTTGEVPRPPSTTTEVQEESENASAGGRSTTEATLGKRSYSGPDTGIDHSWNDSPPGDSDREKWVPYQNEAWLRWQYDDLEKTVVEIADYCGVSHPTILRHMNRHGIERRGRRDGGAGDSDAE